MEDACPPSEAEEAVSPGPDLGRRPSLVELLPSCEDGRLEGSTVDTKAEAEEATSPRPTSTALYSLSSASDIATETSNTWLAAALAAGSAVPLSIALAATLAAACRRTDLVVLLGITFALLVASTSVRASTSLSASQAARCVLLVPLGGHAAFAGRVALPLLTSDLLTQSAAAAAALLIAAFTTLFEMAALRSPRTPSLIVISVAASLMSGLSIAFAARAALPSKAAAGTALPALQTVLAAAAVASVLSLAHGSGRWAIPAISLAVSPVIWRDTTTAPLGNSCGMYEGRSHRSRRCARRLGSVLASLVPYVLGLGAVLAGIFLGLPGLGIALVPLCYWLARTIGTAASLAARPAHSSASLRRRLARVAGWFAELAPASLLGAMAEPRAFAIAHSSIWDAARRRGLVALMAACGAAAEAAAGTWGKAGAGGSIALYSVLLAMLLAEAWLATRTGFADSEATTFSGRVSAGSRETGTFSLRLPVAESRQTCRSSRIALATASSFDRPVRPNASREVSLASLPVARGLASAPSGPSLDMRIGQAEPEPEASASAPRRRTLERCGRCLRVTLAIFFYGAALFFLAMWCATHDPAAARWAERHSRLRGVNLGGWLVGERWLNVRWEGDGYLFRRESNGEHDDYTASQARWAEGTTAAVLEFREKWYTRETLLDIAEHGVESVRVPFGYWITVDNESEAYPHIRGRGLGYLDDVVGWAEAANLSVVLDLHGAPGSQSGEQQSGYLSHSWEQGDWDAEGSLRAIEAVAQRYAGRECVIGVELLNEPLLDASRVLDFYQRGAEAVRRHMGEEVAVIINLYEAQSIPTHAWASFNWLPAHHPNIVYDIHLYTCFHAADWVPLWFATGLMYEAYAALASIAFRPTFVGEWSNCISDWHGEVRCEVDGMSASEKRDMYRGFGGRQVRAILRGSRGGGHFWTWFHPNRDDIDTLSQWDMKFAIEQDLIPGFVR